MCMHNGNFPQEWGVYLICLFSCLVSTNDLAMRGARVSATMEMSHFSWNIPISASEGFLKIFFYF